jgi:hypothetical protein
VKYCAIIADRLGKVGWTLGESQPLILSGERSGLLTRTATTESALLCMLMKSSARFWNWNVRFVRRNAQRTAQRVK